MRGQSFPEKLTRPICISTSDGVERVTDKAGVAEVKHLTLCGDVFVVNPLKQKFERTGLHLFRFGSGAPSVLQELRMIIRIVHGRR